MDKKEANAQESLAKHPRQGANHLVNFHFKLLLGLLRNHGEVREVMLLLQDSLMIINTGAKAQIFQWHLKHVKRMVPVNVEILEVVNMLAKCISYKEKL